MGDLTPEQQDLIDEALVQFEASQRTINASGDLELIRHNARLIALEKGVPKNALRLKPKDGHHHMEPVRLLEEGTDKGFGFELDFLGATVTRGSNLDNRKFTITTGGLGFCHDYLVMDCWTGTEGYTQATPNSSCSFKVFSTIQGAITDAEAVNGTNALSFYICPGDYPENVTINKSNLANQEHLFFYGAELENGVDWGSGSSGDALAFTGANSNLKFYFEHIRFRNPAATASVDVGSAATECHFNRCVFVSSVEGSFNASSFDHCLFQNGGYLVKSGTNAQNVSFDYCIFNTGATSQVWVGGGNDLRFNHCQFPSTQPIQITAGSWDNIVFDTCRFNVTGSTKKRVLVVVGSATIIGLSFEFCVMDQPADSNGCIYFETFTAIQSFHYIGNRHSKANATQDPYIVNGHSTAVINSYIAGNSFGRDSSSEFYVETEDSSKFSVGGKFEETVFGPNAPATIVQYSITSDNDTNEFYPPQSAIGTSTGPGHDHSTDPEGGTIPASSVTLPIIGAPTYTHVEDLNTVYHSSGWISGGAISDAGGGNINVAAGQGALRVSDSAVAQLKFIDWPANNGLAITADSRRYVGVELNDPNDPQVVVRTSFNWDFNTDFPIGTVVNEGGALHITFTPHKVGDHASSMIQRVFGVNHIAYDAEVGGIAFSETGTRNVVVSAGQFWVGLESKVIAAINTSGADTFDGYSSQGKEDTGISQWPNTLYDNGSGGTGTLQTLGANKWANLWWYIELDGHLVMVYGTDQYTSAAKAGEEAVPTTIPDRLQEEGKLAARFIFQKSAATASQILSAFAKTFTVTGVTDHGDLGGLSDVADHAYALLIDGSRKLTSDWDAGLTESRVITVAKINTDTVNEGSADSGVRVEGVLLKDNTLFLVQKSAANAEETSRGQLWVKNDSPNTPQFTDGAGNDRALIWAGGAFHDGFSDFVALEHVPVTDATSDPLQDGTAADGTEATVARKDHVHPFHHAESHVHDAGVVTFTPAVLTDWDADADPGDVDNALDQLAERVDDVELAGGHAEAHAPESHTGQGATAAELETLTDTSDADALHGHGGHGVTHVGYASIAETDTGTEAGKAVTPDGLQGSKRNIRYIQVRLLGPDTDCAVEATIGGDFVIPFTGTLLQDDANKDLLFVYNDTAGVGGGPMIVDIHKGGATIMTTNKLQLETGEKTSTTATTQPDLTTTAVTKGDIFTFDIDSGVHSTPAKGLVVAFAIRES